MNKALKINENIAALRKKQGLSQVALAGRLRISNQAISKWELGKCYPDIILLPALSSLFDISIDELLLGDLTK